MTSDMLLLLTLIFHVSQSFAQYKDIHDDIELIKCEMKELKRKNEDILEGNKKQKIEIDTLKTIVAQQKKYVTKAMKQSSILSSFCQSLPSNVCGSCTCVDNYELEKRYYCDCQHLKPMRDCLEFYDAGNNVSGLYKVTMNNLKLTQVYCDQETDNGGWAVIQRRLNGKTKFYRDWMSYKEGFGSPHQEYWFGNDNLYILTLQSVYPKGSEMRIDMLDWEDTQIYAKYASFLVDNETGNYTLHVGGYSGNAGDSLISKHNGMKFSTYDRDNDVNPDGSCSRNHRGAWWYGYCHASNLNGEYLWYGDKQPGYARGVIWGTYKGLTNSMKYVEMKVRRLRQ